MEVSRIEFNIVVKGKKRDHIVETVSVTLGISDKRCSNVPMAATCLLLEGVAAMRAEINRGAASTDQATDGTFELMTMARFGAMSIYNSSEVPVIARLMLSKVTDKTVPSINPLIDRISREANVLDEAGDSAKMGALVAVCLILNRPITFAHSITLTLDDAVEVLNTVYDNSSMAALGALCVGLIAEVDH